MPKLTTETFISKAQSIHKEEDGSPKYDYTLTNYTGADEKVSIICKIHGVFDQRASKHISRDKYGCPKCGTLAQINERKMMHRPGRWVFYKGD